MATDTGNSLEMAEKLSIDPVFDTNWCDMPASVKLKCIRKMEFKERLSMRCTATGERSLVDSQNIDFQEGEFWTESYDGDVQVSLYSKNGNKFSKNLRHSNGAFKFLKYIWKIGVFEKVILEILYTPYERKIEKYTAEISAKNVDLEFCDGQVLPTILQKMRNGVESITTHYDSMISSKFDFDEVIASPHFKTSPTGILSTTTKRIVYKVAQIWIDKSSKIGSTFQASINEIDGSFDEFLKHFADRVVSKNEKRVRIRTNDPSLHILLERAVDNDIKINYLQFFRLTVISSEMKEAEYDDSCKEWVCKMEQEAYLEEWECEFSFAPRPLGRPSSSDESDEDS
ncbi:hypothetical protein L3Y34_003330 [Caenorhabditis briggsae]|uniref:F-box domain-containing protein n=1 Tax=Caenorhabditis briggsae TaxID=6238 RepID=A0AAE9AFP5_CAEBR|nr:hypothetical protein L3Y34_003330 [Caenorhabditis briggsae]